ncbi:hypothetical protein R1flu_010675 [Riccia fluitans]|uniref:Uncharacterized protein n=1 Tax=Riccia fluitans TaxID=41844 RepID=A0ABD1Z5T3_9MARC
MRLFVVVAHNTLDSREAALFRAKHSCFVESIIKQRVMENLGASSSQQPSEELVQEVNALEARRANLEATLARMGSVEDPRPRPIDPEVSR